MSRYKSLELFKFGVYVTIPVLLVGAIVYRPENLEAIIRNCLVTGGNGFLGQHLVAQLADSGEYEVTVFDIRPPVIPFPGVKYITGDLTKEVDVDAACKGKNVVFHCATAAPTAANAANLKLMDAVNVQGTRSVVEACARHGVSRLVYTSSASVVFDGSPLVKVDESTPYAARHMDYYTGTKAQGEVAVLAANGRGGLRTLALRPSGIFGEHDTLLVPSVASNAARGKLKYIIGSGRNCMDWTYAGNGLGYPRPSVRLPFHLVFFIALLMQYVILPLLAPFKKIDSDFTPFRIKLASVDRTFSCEAAKRELGYRPAVSLDEGLRRTLASFQHLRRGVGGARPKST
ncbi:Sterol-4-alpha-carboxylate 3-dehydrogenase, decarboxylating [Auxenochlorella protothecoides]|uniref:Sterol-4-alpha-carboxylate 3-dehydrogenase, decarboxylating n=1 Tax=Auxenochlorella protothecoides TaxID=3075 RepID=A0A087SIF3_AUXPR|nr:Sterol-4-alpha-carboxylate 3-dehydrogenase, decarboxylating [Auxenochlorella protothecoides]KFM25507.1 Sterol-4-alpha-carboxylate 3-dehydrogenase, decarboxylating [Auxenochlorella protothecoides]